MSWPYITADVRRALIQHGSRLDLFMDCGAVTAYAAGRELSVDNYCKFLEGLDKDGIRPWAYMALDRIGDPEQTRANHSTMMKRGFKPIPVWTRNDDPERLDELFTHSKIVAIGGLATRSGSRIAYMQKAMDLAAGRPVHLLGMSSVDGLKRLRPFSSDSSSWESAARYGKLIVYDGMGKFRMLDRASLLKRPDDSIIHRLRELGCDPFALKKDAAWRGGSSMTRAISAASWCALSRDLVKNVGTRLFLAAANQPAMMALVRAHVYQTEGATV